MRSRPTAPSAAAAGAATADRSSVSIEYVPAIAEDAGNEGDGKVDNIGRTFGATNVFRPQKVLSREGVTVLNVFGFHSGDPTKKRTVAAALQPSSAAP